MKINGFYGVDHVPRVVEIYRDDPNTLMIHIHHPTSSNAYEKIRVSLETVRDNVDRFRSARFVTLNGRIRKEKRIDIQEKGQEIYLWIRTVDAGPDDGWAIIAPAEPVCEALQIATGFSFS